MANFIMERTEVQRQSRSICGFTTPENHVFGRLNAGSPRYRRLYFAIIALFLLFWFTPFWASAAKVSILEFPENVCLGRLFYANAKAFYPRKYFKKAQGKIEFGSEEHLGLEVSTEGAQSRDFWTSKGLQELTILDFSRGIVDDTFIAGLIPLRSLSMLRLEGSNLSDKSIPIIAKLPALRVLYLQRTQIHGLNLSCFANSHLAKLYIGNNTLDPKTFDELSKLRSLKSLGLDYADFSWRKSKPGEKSIALDRLSAPHLAKIGNLKDLEELSFSGLNIGTESLKVLSNFPKLEHLRLASTNVQWKSLQLIKSPDLEWLNLSHCSSIDDSACSVIASFKKLSYLNLSATSITPIGLDAISNLNIKRLEMLGLNLKGSDLKFLSNYHNLATLELQNTGIEDSACNVFLKLTALRTLIVSENHISDASIKSFIRLRNLRVLDVSGTDISEKGFKTLKENLPKCKVLWG